MLSLHDRGSKIPWVPLCLIFLGAALWPEMELLVPSLPAMKDYFLVSDGEIQQLLSVNFLGFIGGVLFAGPLCDSWGRKKVIVGGMALFLLASLGAALADTFSMLMVARFIQGATVTAPVIGGCTMLLETTVGPRQIFWMSISSATVTLCMAVAPIIGAWINTAFGFRGNLWAIFVAALIGIVPTLLAVPESLASDQRTPLRPRLVIASYGQLLSNRRFMQLSMVMAALSAAYWVYTGVSALYLVDYLKLDESLFGAYQGPIVGTFAILSLGIGQLHAKFGLSTCLCLGFAAMFVGAGALLTMALAGFESAMLTTTLMMLFVGGMVPANSLLFPSALNQLPPQLQGSGQALIQALRLLLASAGTSTLGLTYAGPFLPVAMVIVTMLAASTVLLWKARHLLDEKAPAAVGAAH